MNERIKELTKQAGLNIDGYGYPIWGSLDSEDAKKEFLEKFAESIVQECIDKIIANQFGDDGEFDRGCRSCSNTIKQHFGVE